MLPDESQARFYQLIIRSAQVAQQEIDNEGEGTPISDEARLRALNVLSYALNHAAAWAAARDLLLAMATKMEMAGHRQDWLRYLTEGLRQSQQLGDRPAAAAFSFYCGHLQRLMSQYAEAQTLLQASASLYAALGDQPGEAKALNQLAYLAWQQHKPNEAITLAQRAMALLDENDLERAMSLSALGLAAIEQHRWQEAEEFHRTALQIRTAHGNRRQRAWSLQNLADALRGQGQYEVAVAYYEQAIPILSTLDDLANCAIAQMNLGIVYWLQGELDNALLVYAAAESTFHKTGDRLNKAKVLVCKGLDYLALKQWKSAEEAFAVGADLFDQLGDRSEYLNALDGVGISYLEQGLSQKALKIFESINAQLPQIVGTRAYPQLTEVINNQLEQAKRGIKKTDMFFDHI